MSLWFLLPFVVLGGLLGAPGIRRLLVAIERLPYRRRKLRCIVPYAPAGQRPVVDVPADAPLSTF
jgi:hypothetical protein